MLEVLTGAALIAATITTGLSAGLFYAFTVAVMPGLARAEDRTFVHAMQRINTAILNGWFLLGFLGAFLFTALATVLHLGEDVRRVLPWTGAALLLYGATLVITAAVNVPLNNDLDAAGKAGRTGDAAAVRKRFEARWVRWNRVRTLTSTVAFACLVTALVRY